MSNTTPAGAQINKAAEIVMACVHAVNSDDFATARTFVADDMSFVGVMGATTGGDEYVNYLEAKNIKYKVHHVFANGNVVCLIYNLLMGEHSIYGSAVYTVNNDLIDALRVVFDPRPLLAGK